MASMSSYVAGFVIFLKATLTMKNFHHFLASSAVKHFKKCFVYFLSIIKWLLLGEIFMIPSPILPEREVLEGSSFQYTEESEFDFRIEYFWNFPFLRLKFIKEFNLRILISL